MTPLTHKYGFFFLIQCVVSAERPGYRVTAKVADRRRASQARLEPQLATMFFLLLHYQPAILFRQRKATFNHLNQLALWYREILDNSYGKGCTRLTST